MRFKRIIAGAIAVLSIGMCFTACGSSDSSKGSSAEEKIVGEWEGRGAVFYDEEEEKDDYTFTFNKSGTGGFSKTGAPEQLKFNWDISGDNLTLSESDGRYPLKLTYDFSNDDRTLKLVYHSESDNKNHTYTYYRVN
ncbi:MAG: lipocalin family protein [Ruminococcus sp.]|nr:lipocalin family protein [Ruminococcus sp.]